jgi:hypothetical protein
MLIMHQRCLIRRYHSLAFDDESPRRASEFRPSNRLLIDSRIELGMSRDDIIATRRDAARRHRKPFDDARFSKNGASRPRPLSSRAANQPLSDLSRIGAKSLPHPCRAPPYHSTCLSIRAFQPLPRARSCTSERFLFAGVRLDSTRLGRQIPAGFSSPECSQGRKRVET